MILKNSVELHIKTKIAIIVSTPMVARVFLAHQINTLVELYDVTIITNLKGNRSILDNISSKVNIINLPMERNINLFADLKALLLLVSIFYKNRFSLVHSVSPKAGLLTSIAAWIVRAPNRLHTFTGQVWATKKGVSRWFLRLLDKIIVTLNTNILVDSFSQQDFLIKEGVLSKDLSIVLGSGSIGGVDINRFQPSKVHRSLIRKQLNIKDDCLIFLFVGRLKKEKGVFELVEAFKNICNHHDNVVLLIVGPDEEGLKKELTSYLETYKKFVRFIDFTKMPEQYMAASDIFILPSYREGFGSVIIEAASCGLPSIGSNIYGLSDAIKMNETGLLVLASSSKLLEKAMLKLVNNDTLRNEMGLNARKRATHHFSQEDITLKVLQLYKRLIKE
jgi:glycosyltransferase involved in cell wall biosynthesis